VVAQRCGQATAVRQAKQGRTPEIWRSEPLNQRNPARTASNQIARGRNAAFLTVFPQTLKRDWLLDDPACSELLIIRQPAGTNFPLEPWEAERLQNLWTKTGVDWSRAESIAALQTYLALYGKQISRKPGSPVAALAMLIGRAVTGAYNKIMNFRAIDPRDSRAGMDGASNVDRSVWAEFFNERGQTIGPERC